MTYTSKANMIGGLAMLTSLLLTTTGSVEAQQWRNCAPRDVVLTRLAESYGETRQSVGLGANNAVIEVFASEATGSWTITVTTPNGLTCLVASGQAFEEVVEALPTQDSDA